MNDNYGFVLVGLYDPGLNDSMINVFEMFILINNLGHNTTNLLERFVIWLSTYYY